MGNQVFALDIGTRSVTGILMEKLNDKFEVLDYHTIEHKERSMRDGQIHNVIAVSDVIGEVKEILEQRSERKLKRVCVAAAGRALKTTQAQAEISLNQQPITNGDTIKHLELSAVQAAQLKLAQLENSYDYTNYYCVGYSVLHYKIDQDQIGSLIDQSGEVASVEIIATFLPKIVVESLLASLTRADLEMEALTLEPIAAIHVLIPESMRRLNVALVDIGAGTSDIAITDKGTVAAYGMVPKAGDAITEAISDSYLLDFPMAEQMKRNIVTNGSAVIKDILGFESSITYETLITDVSSKVEELAASIAEEIIQLNSKPPKAVMLVGGGSLTPDITSAIASKLQLPANRVAVRGIDAIQELNKNEKLPSGPDFVTPIGIAIAAKQNPVHYITIVVNERTIRMFEMKQLTVGDCLVQAGIDINMHYGRPGIASIVSINGKAITLPGEYGTPPAIYLNNERVTVDSHIQNGDTVTIDKGKDGREPRVSLNELIEELPSLSIYYNESKYKLTTDFYVNNQLKSKEYTVQDKDNIVLNQIRTVGDFITKIGTDQIGNTKDFSLFINNKKTTILIGEAKIIVNDNKVKLDYLLKPNDRLYISAAKEPRVVDLLNQLDNNYWNRIEVTFNGEPITMKQQRLLITRENTELNPDSLLKPDDFIEIKEKNHDPFIFQDVFRYVDIDRTSASGKFKLSKNDQSTTFDDVLHDGDQLRLDWD
ncbi:cell division protein FtsA [Virgibacillus sp. C22-A2]|uniref:Cell division protein FtsA n=1 Tax=Virgibacillus tibetensis TaxID=3042313 RepID=A0ABU6KAQ5_9BACI|nr:cell division protein FtsA [Virgibacillus sp. C22-A2]